MYVTVAVLLRSYTRRTGTASSVPHGNESWISKPSATSFLPIGRMVQTTTNPILGNTNSCALTQLRANLPAPTANATSQVLTGSSLLTSTEPVSSPLLYLSEPPFGTIPSTVLGGLARSSNPPTPSDDTSYGSSTTQVRSYSTSLIPPTIRRFTPPVALGASKHMTALTRSKAYYMVNHLASSRPPPFAPVAPSARNGHTTPRSYTESTKTRISTLKTSAFETKTLISTLKTSAFETKTLISTLKTSAFETKTLISTLKTSAFKSKTFISTPKTTISTPESIMPTSLYPQSRGFREIRLPCFDSLSLRLTLAVSTPVVSFRSTHHSVCIVWVCV